MLERVFRDSRVSKASSLLTYDACVTWDSEPAGEVWCGWRWLVRASQHAMAATTLTMCWRLLIESLLTRIRGRP